MGLWARITRVFRAGTGAALDKIENPELVLQQTIRDMRDRVPDLNNSVAQVMATERLLLKNHENLEKQVVDLDSKIKAAVKMGRDDIATAYIGQLQQAQLDRERTSAQLEHASSLQQALKARDNYVLNMKKRTSEAMQLISAAKQAKLQEQLAQTMETFNIGDDASTFNEMREKIDRRVAAAEANCSSVQATSIRRWPISNAKRWTFSFRTSFSNTNRRWACSARVRAQRPANRSVRVPMRRPMSIC
jgi:phage shock protein A